MPTARETVSALRTALAGLDPVAGSMAADLIPLGPESLDGPLGGGLRRAALHEIYPSAGLKDAAAATGFGLGAALRAGGGRPLAWIRQDVVGAEIGRLHGAGLAAFGADPDRLLLVRAADQTGGLRATLEALRCPALGGVLVEFWGASRGLDLTATRRLALAANSSGVTLVMVRLGASPAPSAATTRWSVAATASGPLEANAPGRPAFTITLLRHRAGIPGRPWHVEWDCDRVSFADPAPLSRPVVPVPAGREAGARDEAKWRLAG
jgi:protein ImuA